MSRQFAETAPGGAVSGRKTVRRQDRGLVFEYRVESTAGEPVSVRLSDRVPTGPADEFGFHEDHAPGEWSLADGDLEMAVTLDPGAERTVVFGLVAAGDELAYDPGTPDVEVGVRGSGAARSAPDDGGSGRAGDDAGDDAGGSSTSAGRTLDDGDEGGAVDLVDPADDGQTSGGAAGEGARVDADGGVVDSGHPSAGDVVSALVEELEAGSVSASELATLREHLGGDRPESEAARLEYVQKRMGDFDAYVDALEELLSVHGSGEDAVTEIEGRLEAFADDLEAVRRRQDELAERVDDLAGALDTHAETVESLQVAHEEDVAEVRSELRRQGETVRDEVDDLRRAVDADLAALEAEIEAFESIRRSLVDGLRRPEDGTGDSTVGDGDPDVSGRSGAPDESTDGDRESTAGTPEADRDLEESLETTAASNVSGANPTTGDEVADTPGADEGSESTTPADEGSESTATRTDDGPGADAAPVLSLEEADDDEESTEPPEDGEQNDDGRAAGDGHPDHGFVSPVREDTDARGGDTPRPEDDDDGAAFEIPGLEGNDASDADADVGLAEDPGDDDAAAEDPGDDEDDRDGDRDDDEADAENRDGDRDDADDSDGDDDGDDGRASSIFEIGDVDAGGGGEEKPTIDFEDG